MAELASHRHSFRKDCQLGSLLYSFVWMMSPHKVQVSTARKWARSGTSEKGLFPKWWESPQRSLNSMCRVCKHAEFSVDVYNKRKPMVMFVSSPEMKGPWHTGLGRHLVTDPAAHMGSCGVESGRIREAVLQAFPHSWRCWALLASRMYPAFPISFLFAQRKEGTHIYDG